jgi:hypothetical protein
MFYPYTLGYLESSVVLCYGTSIAYSTPLETNPPEQLQSLLLFPSNALSWLSPDLNRASPQDFDNFLPKEWYVVVKHMQQEKVYEFRTPPSTISSSTLISGGGQPRRLFYTAKTMSLSFLSNA